MIQQISCDIRDKILSTGYINQHFDYCELVKDGEVTEPMFYVGGNQYQKIFNLDVNGHSYLRKAGKMTVSAAPSKQNVKVYSCGGDDNVLVKFPLRLVATVPKEKLDDNAFSDDHLVHEIIQALSADIELTGVEAIDIKYKINSSDTDSISVWRGEVNGIEHQINFKYSYVAIDFTAEIIINPTCLINACSY